MNWSCGRSRRQPGAQEEAAAAAAGAARLGPGDEAGVREGKRGNLQRRLHHINSCSQPKDGEPFPPHHIPHLVPEYTANLELPSSPGGSVAPGLLWFSSAVPLQSQKLPGWPKASRDTSLRTLRWRRYLLGILQYLNPSSRETLATGLVC